MRGKKNKSYYPSGVYAIHNITKDIFYIGSSHDVEKRWKQHQTALKAGKHNNKMMQSDYNEGDIFIYGLIKEVYPDSSQLIYEEKIITNEYRKKAKIYNIAELTAIQSTKTGLEHKILDFVCKKRFGRSFDHLCVGLTAAGYDMYYEIITSDPEEEQAIREKYEPLIRYQNKLLWDKYQKNK